MIACSGPDSSKELMCINVVLALQTCNSESNIFLSNGVIHKESKKSHEKRELKKSKLKSSSKKDSVEKHKTRKREAKSTLEGFMKKKPSRRVDSEDLENKFSAMVEGAKKMSRRNVYVPDPSSKLETTETGSSLPGFSEQQLLKIVSVSAFADQDRLTVLNARDNLIRLREGRSKHPKKKKITGTCSDMCPERERYRRTVQNCLSVLEMKSLSTKEPDHRLMIKEYSRSSADQQEPLPNELRPVSILQMTMDFLICNVLDKKDESLSPADWYDFIWNRTRSIRKDITQQQICNLSCVEIIEKCIRFHILCAELMSEEDRATFDPKINNENLNKSLQTLKHMYEDLQSKGIQCLNEAEFRAYDVLLSLTEGEALRLVKDIRIEIVKSSELRFAFSAALAFKSNNHVKFFKLMEKASYLSSCIMHRFVNEVRVRALITMIRAFCIAQSATLYPLSNLTDELKFEDELEAASFCQWHSLKVSDKHVTLQRSVFQHQDTPYPVSRSHRLVGSKCSSGFAEIVNNGTLPQNPLFSYEPTSSFNETGYLLSESYAIDTDADPTTPIPIYQAPDVLESQNNISTSNLFSEDSMVDNADSGMEQMEGEDYDDGDEGAILEDKTIPRLPVTVSSTIVKSPRTSIDLSFKQPNLLLKKDPLCEEPKAVLVQSTPKSPSLSRIPTVEDVFTAKNISFNASGPTLVQKEDVFKPCKKSFFDVIIPEKMSIPKKSNAASGFSFKQSNEIPRAELSKDFKNTPAFKVPVQDSSVGLSKLTKDETESKAKKVKITIPEPEPMVCENVPLVKEFEKTTSESEIGEIGSKWNLPEDLLMAPFLPSVVKSPLPSLLASPVPSLELEDLETLEKMRLEKMEELISDVLNEVNSECLNELSAEICERVLAEEWKRKYDLDDHISRTRSYLAEKTLYKWKLFCQRQKQRRSFRNGQPLSPWVPMLMNTEYVTSGAANPFTTYKEHCSITRLAEEKLKTRRSKPGWEPFSAHHFESLDGLQNFPAAFLKKTGVRKFFKLILVTHSSQKEDSQNVFREWLHAKFKITALEICEENEEAYLSFHSLNGGKTVICTRSLSFDSFDSPSSAECLRGTSAIILCFPDVISCEQIFKNTLEKLDNSLRRSCFQPIPMFAFFDTSVQIGIARNQVEAFLLQRIESQRVIKTVKEGHITNMKDYVNNSTELLGAFKWLVVNQEQPPLLLHSTLRRFLDDSFAAIFSVLLWKVTLKEFRPLMLMPEVLIGFYNQMFNARASVLCSEFLHQVLSRWPPNEITLFQPEYESIEWTVQEECERLLSTMLLPHFKGDPTSLDDLQQYLKYLTNSDSPTEILFVSIKGVPEINPDAFDWCNIIPRCAHYLISSHSSQATELLNKDVFYLKEDLDSIDLDWYWEAVSELLEEQSYQNLQNSMHEISLERSAVRVGEIESSICEKENCPPSYTKESSNSYVENVMSTLQAALRIQNTESDRINKKLDASIAEQNFQEGTETDVEIYSGTEYHCPNSSINPIPEPCDEVAHNTNPTESDCSLDLDNILSKSLSSQVSSPTSISDKLAELRYNIQKNNIIEDNLSLLLDL